MTQTLSLREAERFIAAAKAGECLPIGAERSRVRYWLPEKLHAAEWLCLVGFDELDDEAAEILAEHKGRLTLSSITQISDFSAQWLSRHQGCALELDGLADLSDSAVRDLSRYPGSLSLNGIINLTDVAAAALAQRESRLSLDGLTALVHVQLARKLAAQPRSARNCFKSLIRISEEIAEILVDLPDVLILDKLHLTESLATILARHSHGLRFDNSASITEEVARALAGSQSNLVLGVGPSLSPGVAKVLAKHRAGLWLGGLTSLSEATAEALADHEGALTLCCFRLTAVSDAAAQTLSRHKGPLALVYTENLPATAAEILRRHVQDLDTD